MSLPSALYSGSQTVTESPSVLTGSYTFESGVVVKALSSNSVPVYVGGSGSQSFPLNPGESVSLSIAGTADVYVALGTSVSDQKVAFVGS